MRNSFITHQKKGAESRRVVKILTKEFVPVDYKSRPTTAGFQDSTFPSFFSRGIAVHTSGSPKQSSPFPRDPVQARPSIIEMLFAKHRSSNSKFRSSVPLKKETTRRPATVFSPIFNTDTNTKTPESLRTADRAIRDSPKAIFNLAKHASCDQLDNFVMGSEIGKGAYATVRCARNTQTSSKVAIKIYDKFKLITPSRKKNAEREIKILTRLNHPNIVKLYKTVENKRSLNLVMEYVSGCSLTSYLKQKSSRRLEESEARGIFRQVIEALDYCHGLGISHRDIKLDNILIDAQHCIKLIDFGFSTCFSNEKKVKLFCGTPSYMSPEIVSKQESHGPPSDIWAAGILLFVLLSGSFPFKAPHSADLYVKIQKGSFLMPPHISPDAASLIKAMLSSDPLKRPVAKAVLDYPWLRARTLGKNNSMAEREREVPQIRVSLNLTFDHGKKTGHKP